MQLFILHLNPAVAAMQQCDKHVVKMLLETAQILSSTCRWYSCTDEILYKQTHLNHPVMVWTRQSRKNFEWVLFHGMALCREYTSRYHRVHKSEAVIRRILVLYHDIEFMSVDFTEPNACMPDEYKRDNIVDSYRNFYIQSKSKFAVWKYTKTPEWFIEAV